MIKNRFFEKLRQKLSQKKYAEPIADLENIFKSEVFTPNRVTSFFDENISKTKSTAKKEDLKKLKELAFEIVDDIQLKNNSLFSLDEEVYHTLLSKVVKISYIHNDSLVVVDDELTPVIYLRKLSANTQKVDEVYSTRKNVFDEVNYADITTDLRYIIDIVSNNEIDFNPFYQRGEVWDKERKIKYIEAIFEKTGEIEIKLIFNSYQEYKRTGYSFELLDGKQRLLTLIQFIRGEFPIYGEVYFENLDDKDIFYLLRHRFTYTRYQELHGKEMTKEQKIRLFLALNSYNIVQDEPHIEKLKRLVDK